MKDFPDLSAGGRHFDHGEFISPCFDGHGWQNRSVNITKNGDITTGPKKYTYILFTVYKRKEGLLHRIGCVVHVRVRPGPTAAIILRPWRMGAPTVEST